MDIDGTARLRPRRWLTVSATVAATAAIVAGAAVLGTSVSGGRNARSATATPTTTAPTPAGTDVVTLTRHVPCPTGGTAASAPSREELAAFHAVAAVTCGQEERSFRGAGEWEVAVRQVGSTGVAALQASYELPSEPQSNGLCLTNLVGVSPVALVDADGRSLVPGTPVDGCRKPLSAVISALRAVEWRDVSVRKLRQLVTPQAQAAGCPMAWKNENWMYAQFGTHRSPGGPVFVSAPATVRVCLYRVRGSDFEVGDFVRGFRLDEASTKRLLGALTGPGPTGSCPGVREFAVALASPGLEANVELGGCWRVQRPYPNPGTGTADPAVVRTLHARG
jgi:hypothetical protein